MLEMGLKKGFNMILEKLKKRVEVNIVNSEDNNKSMEPKVDAGEFKQTKISIQFCDGFRFSI
jgi:hypothetical protein